LWDFAGSIKKEENTNNEFGGKMNQGFIKRIFNILHNILYSFLEIAFFGDDALVVKTDLLLIDEPDAHLNPSLMRNLYNVLKKISENGTRVVITTHNPVFINLVDHASLFWMEGGSVEKKHKNKHKETICNALGNGLFTEKNVQGIFRLFNKDATMPRVIILCEGSNDALNIEAMICEGRDGRSDI
jgi:hypothetical protein